VSSPSLDARDLRNDAIWLRVMVDGSDVASDRDSAERLWPETRENLRDIADALERLAKLEERAKKMAAKPGAPFARLLADYIILGTTDGGNE
jgi:hypothetical protein